MYWGITFHDSERSICTEVLYTTTANVRYVLRSYIPQQRTFHMYWSFTYHDSERSICTERLYTTTANVGYVLRSYIPRQRTFDMWSFTLPRQRTFDLSWDFTYHDSERSICTEFLHTTTANVRYVLILFHVLTRLVIYNTKPQFQVLKVHNFII